MLATIYWNE